MYPSRSTRIFLRALPLLIVIEIATRQYHLNIPLSIEMTVLLGSLLIDCDSLEQQRRRAQEAVARVRWRAYGRFCLLLYGPFLSFSAVLFSLLARLRWPFELAYVPLIMTLLIFRSYMQRHANPFWSFTIMTNERRWLWCWLQLERMYLAHHYPLIDIRFSDRQAKSTLYWRYPYLASASLLTEHLREKAFGDLHAFLAVIQASPPGSLPSL